MQFSRLLYECDKGHAFYILAAISEASISISGEKNRKEERKEEQIGEMTGRAGKNDTH